MSESARLMVVFLVALVVLAWEWRDIQKCDTGAELFERLIAAGVLTVTREAESDALRCFRETGLLTPKE